MNIPIRILGFVLLINVSVASAQPEPSEGCFTMERAILQAQSDTAHANRFAQLFREQPISDRGTNTLITVPVVVHIVYNTSMENITQSQIQSGIDVLNEDFRRTNPDWVYTNSNYVNLSADCEINFCLVATIRTSTSNADFPVNGSLWTYGDVDYVKDISPGYGQGYLNIWVCDIQGSMYGYAVFPGMAPVQYEGVTVDYQYFGTTGAANPSYAGRTVTHEVGHWFGLFHIWGMSTGTYGSYCDDDYVSDTWPQHRSNPNGCNYDVTSCPNYGPGYTGPYNGMNENFMDYTQGSCMTFFSAGQKQRITAMILSYRPYLITSPIACNTAVEELEPRYANFTYDNLHNTINFSTVYPCSSTHLEVFDAAGKLIHSADNKGANNATNFNYTLPELPSGTYFVTFSFDARIVREKLMVLN